MMQSAAPERFDVAISGASFAGLSLACALSQAFTGQWRISLIDKAARPQARIKDARSFALSAASRQMLDRLGIWQGIADEAQPVTGIDITDSGLDAGIRPILLAYENQLDDGAPASSIVPAGVLWSALNKAVEADRAIELIAPAQVSAMAVVPASVELTLNDVRRVSAPVVVAAEGRNSRLRELAGIKTVSWQHHQIGIVATVRHERDHKGRAVQHFLPSGPFAILPLPGRRSCITWSEDSEEARRILALNDADFLAEIEKRFGGRLGDVALDGSRQSWPLETHLARKYVAPRLALVGDAAHIVHPLAGQGLNLGLRDVAALTQVLAEAARLGLDIGKLDVLERYERWRRFDSWLSAATFDGLNRLFSSDVTLLRSAREFGLGVVDRLPGLKQMFVTEAAGLAGEVPKLLRGEAV